jgi:hypothetical protein
MAPRPQVPGEPLVQIQICRLQKPVEIPEGGRHLPDEPVWLGLALDHESYEVHPPVRSRFSP